MIEALIFMWAGGVLSMCMSLIFNGPRMPLPVLLNCLLVILFWPVSIPFGPK